MKRENICEYENYESPWLEVIEVEVEKGFNASTEGLDDEELL
jgi:hypothetical protein